MLPLSLLLSFSNSWLLIPKGDSMILHEVMKYKELELVVGLELDKGVVQASFIYFETLPHFDKDKVVRILYCVLNIRYVSPMYFLIISNLITYG